MNINIEDELIDAFPNEIEYRLAILLLEDVIFCNNGHWNEKWPKDHVTLHVNCNDIFYWGCADSEDVTHDEIKELYDMHKKDPSLGSAAWCIKKRKQMPQGPVIELFKKSGLWDLDELIK